MRSFFERGCLPRACAAVLVIGTAAPALGAEAEEIEEIVVQSTRFGRRVEDEAIRVEVINQEEIEEKLMMRPGNIAMLLSETGGLRVQVTAPALGAANIRVQGLRGRYTQLLTDGLPLYGGQSLGLLQIPPTDLGQVEVIKGAASALYGPAALGGVINLVARRPGSDPEQEILFNATTRDGQDLTGYVAGPLSDTWGYSVVAGAHRQSRQDIDGDGWADLPGYERWTARPRLFWKGDNGESVFATIGAMTEQRRGGTLPGRSVPDGAAFQQAQDSQRLDGGVVAAIPFESGTLHVRGAAMLQDHAHRFGPSLEDDRHDTLFAEASYAGGVGTGTAWIAGVAMQSDGFHSKAFPAFSYHYDVPAMFAQVEQDLSDDLTLAGSARWDAHNVYGSRVSPRLSLLYKPGAWTLRASVGEGFYAPTPFVEEIEAAGLSRLQPLTGLKAETARTASLDGGYAGGPFETSVTLFASRIASAVHLDAAGASRAVLHNAPGPTRTYGGEMMLRYRWEDLTLTGSYVHVRASEPDPAGAGRRETPLTPRHSAGLVAMWERYGAGRLGFEAYYTGRQELDNDPYRTLSRPYVEMGLLGEIVLGKATLFINLENLLDVRQTKYAPLLLPRRSPDGRWTVDAWTSQEGFTANAGVRLRFGGG